MQLSPEERQRMLDEIPKEDLEKVQRITSSQKIKVDTEDLIEAEFLMKFGFEAYWAINPEYKKEDGIDISEMLRLLAASKKIDSKNIYYNSLSTYIGASTAMSKQGFKSAGDKLAKQAEADE